VITRNFEQLPEAKAPFYEASWFATIVRNVVALIAELLVLLLGVRPLIKTLRSADARARNAGDAGPGGPQADMLPAPLAAEEMMNPETGTVDAELLSQQVGLAQRIATERPDDAVVALRQMLTPPAAEPAQ
jgi:flagellar M-ring protein FliF